MPVAKEAPLDDDIENPGLRRKASRKPAQEANEESARCSCALLRKGWFWACLVTVVAVCVVAPLGHRAWVQRNALVTDPPQYKFNTTFAPMPAMFDPNTGTFGKAGANQSTTCADVSAELPSVNFPKGTPAPPLKLDGAQFVLANSTSRQPVQLLGVNWFGFNNGKTMVDGLDAEKQPTWEGGDFATIVHQLRLLGFNSVRLPFLFTDLYQATPTDYTKACPQEPVSEKELLARTTAPGVKVPANAKAPEPLLKPEGYGVGFCNGYVPTGPTTITRYLWVVEYFVANGFYVLVDYHPDSKGEPVLDTVDAFVRSWMRLWIAITCMPSYQSDLKGRIFLDLMNEPDAVNITWDGQGLARGPEASTTSDKAPLSQYYLSVMDAINSHSPGEVLFFIQGGGQDHLGTAWGDGFATDPKWIKERDLADPNAFFLALLSKPYRNQVVLTPHLYGVSVTQSPDVGALQWQKYETSWGHLMQDGYCSAPGRCQLFPVAVGEIGAHFTDPLDMQYYRDMAIFFKKQPPTQEYKSVPFNNWFWWCYNANSGDTGGLVKKDWYTLEWEKLLWLQKNLGLKPWYMS